MKDYDINIIFSNEDGGYIADIPDLKVCSAFGASAEEALRLVELAKAAWLETALTRRQAYSEPKYRPLIYQAG